MSGQPSNDDAERTRGLALHRYLRALDSGDLDTIAEVLALAEADPELDRQIASVNDAVSDQSSLIPRESEP
jgi:hypothetical protein